MIIMKKKCHVYQPAGENSSKFHTILDFRKKEIRVLGNIRSSQINIVRVQFQT